MLTDAADPSVSPIVFQNTSCAIVSVTIVAKMAIDMTSPFSRSNERAVPDDCL